MNEDQEQFTETLDEDTFAVSEIPSDIAEWGAEETPPFTEILSPRYANVIQAVCRASLNFKTMAKTGVNSFFKARTASGFMEYSTLEDIGNATQKALLNEGLMVICTLVKMDDGLYFRCVIVHGESEEYYGTAIKLSLDVNPQKSASLFTYYRRYSITMLLNLTTGEGEDDGNAASGNAVKNKPEAKAEDLIDDAQVEYLKNFFKDNNLEGVKVKKILDAYGITKFAEVRKPDYAAVSKALEAAASNN